MFRRGTSLKLRIWVKIKTKVESVIFRFYFVWWILWKETEILLIHFSSWFWRIFWVFKMLLFGMCFILYCNALLYWLLAKGIQNLFRLESINSAPRSVTGQWGYPVGGAINNWSDWKEASSIMTTQLFISAASLYLLLITVSLNSAQVQVRHYRRRSIA